MSSNARLIANTPTSDKLGTFYDNAKRSITGGGTVYYDSSQYLRWTDRFIVIAVGESPDTATTGYFNIECPPNQTNITGIGDTPDTMATTSGILLSDWSSLWYELPMGSSNASVDGNFYIGQYSSINGFEIPPNWVLVAVSNGDSSANGNDAVKLCNGKYIKKDQTLYPDTDWLTPTLIYNWQPYDTTNYGPVRYRRANNTVYLEGLVKGGSNGNIMQLPSGFRPGRRLLLATTMNSNVHSRLDIDKDGFVIAGGQFSNTWFSITSSFNIG